MPCEIEHCKCKWKDIQLFSGSFRGEIQLDGNINKDKQKLGCQEVGQRRDKDVKWRAEVALQKTFPYICEIMEREKSKNVKIHKYERGSCIFNGWKGKGKTSRKSFEKLKNLSREFNGD